MPPKFIKIGKAIYAVDRIEKVYMSPDHPTFHRLYVVLTTTYDVPIRVRTEEIDYANRDLLVDAYETISQKLLY